MGADPSGRMFREEIFSVDSRLVRLDREIAIRENIRDMSQK